MVYPGAGEVLRMKYERLKWTLAYLKRRLKSGARLGSEVVLAIAAVLICFSFFLIGLRKIFPAGDPSLFLFQGDRDYQPVSYGREGGGVQLSLPEGDLSVSEGGEFAARLTFIQNEVKNKKSEGIVWSRAQQGLALFDHDAVQTLARSRAVVTFDAQNYLDMDENSLVIIKKLEQSRILKEKRSYMVVIDGSLRGRIDGSGPDNVKLEVETPTAVTQVSAKESKDRRVDFQIHVNPDQSSTVTVYKGVAKILAQGVLVEVQENQTTRIDLNAAPKAPQAILEPVLLDSPGEGDRYFYRDFPPELKFRWSKQEQGAQYHLQIAQDASFRERVLDETTSATTFLYGNLRRGKYFWRVSAIDANHVEGQWSATREIEIVQNWLPPLLKILSPQEDRVLNQEVVSVAGESDPLAKVYINGKKVNKDSAGRFKMEIPLQKGANLIVVESIDPAGNSSFQRRVISRKF